MATKRPSFSSSKGGKSKSALSKHPSQPGARPNGLGQRIQGFGKKRSFYYAVMPTADELRAEVYSFMKHKAPSSRTVNGARIVILNNAFYPKEVFDNQAEYDASVDSVVARIKSGEVKARTPDE